MLDLSIDELLTTTRAVRKRLDFNRPVDLELIEECLELALKAPSGSNRQTWQFVVVTDPQKRAALAEVYRKGWAVYSRPFRNKSLQNPKTSQERVQSSATYLADHMHEVPVLVIPCLEGRVDNLKRNAAQHQASFYGSILPAVWSFMLAARSRGLGTCWTTLHLMKEQEAASILDIPYDSFTQVAMIPVAHTIGTHFEPAKRKPVKEVLHLNGW